jgi:hypothetical protein
MAEPKISTWLGTLGLVWFSAACDSESKLQSGHGSAGSKSVETPAMMQPTASPITPTMNPVGMQDLQPSAAPEPMDTMPPASGATPPSAMPAQPSAGIPKADVGDECGLKTQFPGDQFCILPPPREKGFQIHVGPTNYENPDPKYILAPGEETTMDFQVTSTNDEPVHFYYRQFRMRPSAHHNIISLTTGGGFGMGRRIGTSNNLSEDSPKGGVIAPENAGVGIPLDANAPINVNLHSINVTDKPMLRELWINFWYREPGEVTEQVEQMFQTGSTMFAVQPREETMLGPYTCTISGEGRMLWFYGHRHANNVRFSAWRNRGSQRDLFYEGLHWEEPIVLEYSSTVKNRTPDRTMGIEGGWSGILDMKAGDVLEWECHIINKTDEILRFTNETYTGEMCIMDAELVGANCARPGAM